MDVIDAAESQTEAHEMDWGLQLQALQSLRDRITQGAATARASNEDVPDASGAGGSAPQAGDSNGEHANRQADAEKETDVSEWRARLRHNWARIAKARALPVREYLAWIDMEIEEGEAGGEGESVQQVLETAAGDYGKSIEIWRRWLQWAQQRQMDALTAGDDEALGQLRSLFERALNECCGGSIGDDVMILFEAYAALEEAILDAMLDNSDEDNDDDDDDPMDDDTREQAARVAAIWSRAAGLGIQKATEALKGLQAPADVVARAADALEAANKKAMMAKAFEKKARANAGKAEGWLRYCDFELKRGEPVAALAVLEKSLEDIDIEETDKPLMRMLEIGTTVLKDWKLVSAISLKGLRHCPWNPSLWRTRIGALGLTKSFNSPSDILDTAISGSKWIGQIGYMETISIQLAAVAALLQAMPPEEAVPLIRKLFSGLAATVVYEPGTLINFVDNASRLVDPAHALLLFSDLTAILRDGNEDVKQNVFRTMASWERGYGEDLKRMRVLVNNRLKKIKEAMGEVSKGKEKKRSREESAADGTSSRWLYMEVECLEQQVAAERELGTDLGEYLATEALLSAARARLNSAVAAEMASQPAAEPLTEGSAPSSKRRNTAKNLDDEQRASNEAAAEVRAGKHDDTTTIFVANLHFNCDEKELKAMVEELLGERRAHVLHSIRIMKDRATGKSRGLAYVNLKKGAPQPEGETESNADLVQKVVQGLNEKDYKGRKMRAEVSDLSKKRKEKAEVERKTGMGAAMFRPRAVAKKKPPSD